MKDSFLKASAHYPWREKIKRLIFDTPAEIYIGAFVFGTIFGGVSYSINSDKANRIPLAFSEIGKTIRDFERQGKPVPPLTKFYSATNDVPMKVFEAHNIAAETSKKNSTFAGELEIKVNPSLKIHRQIREYAQEIPNDANEALRSLDKVVKATRTLPPIIGELSKTWGENHHDVTHTEYWTTRECDSDGKNCRDVQHSREVYDYTIHTYTYHRQHGENASRLMGDFLKHLPDIKVEEPLHLATKTDIDNEYAIERSMRELLKGKIPSPEQALMFANMWATGSNLTTYQPVISSNHAGLLSVSPQWNAAKGYAKNHRYITYSSSDSGPKEYQIVKSALAYAEATYAASRKIMDGVQFSGQNIPVLYKTIQEFIAVTLEGKSGDPDALRTEIMKLSRDIYQKNFEKGLDVQPFKWEHVVFFSFLGIMIGGLGGAGVDRWLSTRKVRLPSPSPSPSNENTAQEAPQQPAPKRGSYRDFGL